MIAAEKRLLDRVVAMAGKQPAGRVPRSGRREEDAGASCGHGRQAAGPIPNPKEYDAQGSFQPAKETKKIPLDPENPERFAVIGANLDSK